jgi:ComF family protein
LREVVFSSTGFRIRSTRGRAADYGFARRVERAAASIFFTLFPADCRICGSPLIRVSRLPVCEDCLQALRPLEGSFCRLCGEALLSPAFLDRPGALCGFCQRTHPPFDRAVAYGRYDGGLRDMIHLLKYQQVRPVAVVLGQMLGKVVASLEPELPDGPVLVVPVPLHPRKQAQRGFNQAELIARTALKQLAGRQRFHLRTGALLRRRETGSQIGLTRHQRMENLRGAFAVKHSTPVEGSHILLVDDVFTTGTTASECARVLRRAGAASIWVVTVARTLKSFAALAIRDDLWEVDSNENQDRHAAAAGC